MANSRQQRKRVRISQREHEENLRYKSRIKTMFRSLTVAAADDKEHATQLGLELTSVIDKAASRGVIHPRNAAKKKSRITSIVELPEGSGLPESETAEESAADKSKARKRDDRRTARKTKKAEARASIKARAQAAAAEAEAAAAKKAEEAAEEVPAEKPESDAGEEEEPSAEKPESEAGKDSE